MLFLKHKSHVKELERHEKQTICIQTVIFNSPWVYCIFKQIHVLVAEAGEEMWPGGTTESESGAPTGTQTWTACARHINPPCHHFPSCKTERYLLSLVPLVGNMNEQYYKIVTWLFSSFLQCLNTNWQHVKTPLKSHWNVFDFIPHITKIKHHSWY